jgi:hypothetical protein
MALQWAKHLTEMRIRNFHAAKGQSAFKTDDFTAIFEPNV